MKAHIIYYRGYLLGYLWAVCYLLDWLPMYWLGLALAVLSPWVMVQYMGGCMGYCLQ